MATSLFLAQLIGPVMLVMGLFVLLEPTRMRAIGREFLDSEALMFMSGVITMPAGLAIVLTHNVWAADWRVLVTLFGWIAIGAGIARVALPTFAKAVGEQMLEKTYLYRAPAALMALMGAYLSYQGFIA